MRQALSPRRWRISIAGLMVVVAVLAVCMTWLRPISRDDVIATATKQLRGLPIDRVPEFAGAPNWASYPAHRR